MSLSSMIRAAAGGSKKPRAEGDTPEEDPNAEGDQPAEDDPNAEGDQPEEDPNPEDAQPDEEAADDENTDETMSASQRAAFASGRKAGQTAERQRIAAIMGDPAADANPALAAHLAFATGMTAKDARAALAASSPAGGKLAGKMAGSGQPRLGGGAAPLSGGASQPERIAAHAAAIIEAKRARRSR